MVMVFIKAANGNKFLRAPQLALHITVFRADPGLQSQSAIRPQLALSTKTIGGLNQSHQKRMPNRPYVGNLLQLTGDLVLCDSRPAVRAALAGATASGCPNVRRDVRLAGALRRAGFFPTTGFDDAYSRRLSPHKGSPSCD